MPKLALLTIPAALAVLATGFAASRPQPPAARTHTVRMLQQGSAYKYDPAGLRIQPGDTVRWLNVSGFPHNVQFWANRIPAGAQAALNRNMARRMGDLAGPMMLRANETYTIVFAGVPEGTYDYFCLPHLALGMKATLIVGRPGGPGSTINDGEPTPAQVP